MRRGECVDNGPEGKYRQVADGGNTIAGEQSGKSELTSNKDSKGSAVG